MTHNGFAASYPAHFVRVFVNLDDLLVVVSPEFEVRMDMLNKVAQCLESAGLTINVGKSRF